jgi:hypothetical protein
MNEFSVYTAPVTNTIPMKSVTLHDVYRVITSQKYKVVTEKLRAFETKAERDKCKKDELDYATFSGTFTNRSDSALINHSGYFCIDIDHIGDQTEIDAMIEKLLNFYNPALFFRSPSGDGLKIVYKIDIESATHREFYFAFEDYFKTEHGIQIDIACKDVSRACFLCYDEKCFYSENPHTIGIDFINSHKTEIKIEKSEYEQGDRPGDIYNQSYNAIQDTITLLSNAGWKKTGKYAWRRPGKDEGTSATFGKVADNVFFPFSSNSEPFEANKAYTPFQVLALLKFNGDFKEAAKSIAPERTKIRTAISKMEVSEIERILLNAKVDTSRNIERPPVILSIKEQNATQYNYKRLFTLGNFSCIVGKAKSRKTFLLSMITSSILNNNSIPKFVSDLPSKKKDVLYFDTEQGEYDCYNVVRRIERMSGETRMRSFSLREYSPYDRCAIIEHAFKLWGNETAFCVIDGIADLATAINDEEEATRVTTMLLRLTKQYNCHISTVIHQNKNDNFATGHLGSSVMKKAELLISVMKSKDSNSLSDVTCDLSRSIDFEPFCFSINSDGIPEISGMPVSKRQESFTTNFQTNGFTKIEEDESDPCPF